MAFSDFSEYIFKYHELDKKMPDITTQKRYYERWMGKYAKKYKQSEENESGIEWDLRCKKSLREIFSSATFFVEAQKNLEMKCFSSYYFCLYYSLFHAIYACNFLDTESTIDKLKDVTHSNIINVFVSAFANTSHDIMDKEISTLFKELRYRREYYSYVTPFNNIFNYEDDLLNLKQCLLECYQLASFHSLLAQKSFSKKIGKKVEIKNENILYLDTLFSSLFGKKDLNGKYALDYSCKNMMEELLACGCKPENIAIDLDHQFDEFHTYDSYYEDTDNEYALNIGDIWDFIYEALV